MLKIFVDSGASIKPSEAEKYDVEIFPIKVLIDGREYLDGVDLTSEEFYKLLASKKFPKTALPNLEEAKERVEKETKKGNDVLILTISSEISGGYNALRLQFEDNPKVRIVDSRLAVGAIRLLVEEALRYKDKTLEFVAKKVEELIPKVKILAIPETLEYLMKGGRLSKAEWLIGTVLKIKPVITFKDGKVRVEAKKIGLKNAMNYIVEKLKTLGVDENYPIVASYTLHTDNLEKLIESSQVNRDNLVFDDLSFSIASHWGPNAFGFIFVTK